MSGVDTDTRGMGLFQGRRPAEIGAAGDMLGMHPDTTRFGGQICERAGRQTRPLCDMAKTARHLCQPVEFRPHFVTSNLRSLKDVAPCHCGGVRFNGASYG